MTVFSGCITPATGVVKNESRISIGNPIDHNLALVETSSSITNANDEIKLMDAMVISGLQVAQKFGRVSGNIDAPNLSSGIKIYVDIKELYGVSNSERENLVKYVGPIFYGLPGQARILVRVTLSDIKSGNQIQTFEVEGESSTANATDQAVQKAAEQVVAEVVKIIR